MVNNSSKGFEKNSERTFCVAQQLKAEKTIVRDKQSLPLELRLLSFNIQVGIHTRQYHHYFTRSWQHILPHIHRQKNLGRIADVIRDYDIVALQEVDGGSLRSGFVNQVEYLARCAHFPYWYQQLNRNLGHLAQHSNGVLSRYMPGKISDHPLPGLPGRGAIELQFGKQHELIIVAMHLALSRRGQHEQLAYIRDLVGAHQYVILMGDMNVGADQLLLNSPLKNLDLKSAKPQARTFPRWKPDKGLDHILLSESLKVDPIELPDIPVSDHLPVAVTIRFPENN